jgi:hypothetical protein
MGLEKRVAPDRDLPPSSKVRPRRSEYADDPVELPDLPLRTGTRIPSRTVCVRPRQNAGLFFVLAAAPTKSNNFGTYLPWHKNIC